MVTLEKKFTTRQRQITGLSNTSFMPEFRLAMRNPIVLADDCTTTPLIAHYGLFGHTGIIELAGPRPVRRRSNFIPWNSGRIGAALTGPAEDVKLAAYAARNLLDESLYGDEGMFSDLGAKLDDTIVALHHLRDMTTRAIAAAEAIERGA